MRRCSLDSRRARKRESSILILECDPDKLAAQSISIATKLAGLVKTVAPSTTMRLVKGTSRESLLAELGKCKEECDSFGLIVVVGHSNLSGLSLTGDTRVPWEQFPSWIEPFKPKRIILFTCEGGRWLPSKALFNQLLTLQEIYGSPVTLTPKQASILKVLVLYLLLGNRLNPKILRWVQTGNLLLTGGVLFHQTRRDFWKTGPFEAMVWTGIEEGLKRILKNP